MLLSDAIDRYLADRANKGAAPATVSGEKLSLKHLLTDIGNIQVSSIQPRHMDVFWARHSDWSPGTFNKTRAHLTGFFKWCQARAILGRFQDPLEGVRKRKSVPRNWLILPQQEWPALLDATTDPRDRALVAIGLYLFTRISETTALQWKDFDLQNHEATVFRRKTQTLDVLPICEELEYELGVWKLKYAEVMGEHVKPSWYVIPAYSPALRHGIPGQKGGWRVVTQGTLIPNRPMETASSRIKVALKSAGYPVQSGEASHTLRRSGANALYHELSERGHDRAIRMCQAMLGHSSIQTTEVYLQLNLDRKARNDLLAGKRMFTGGGEAAVIQLGGVDGQENARVV